MGKITYLRSKRDGLTIGTASYGSTMLNAGELTPASQLNPAAIALLEEGDPGSMENAELLELEPAEAAKLMGGEDVAEGDDGVPDQVELTPTVTIDDPDDDSYDPSEYTVNEVLEYLKAADGPEVERVKTLEAASDRASTQVASYGT